jgi:hypothetical protein
MNCSLRQSVYLAFALYLVLVSVSVADTKGKKTPPEATAIEAVRQVFESTVVHQLDRSRFEALSPYFSLALGGKIENFLRAWDHLTMRRNQAAKEAGIATASWWPPTVALDVQLVSKDDLLTNRATIPDKLEIGKPQEQRNRLNIVVIEKYIEIADDGTDLGGTKVCRVFFVIQGDRWVIDEIAFRTRQYGREKETTLTEILQQTSRKLRAIQLRIKEFHNEVRPAVPPGSSHGS